MAPEPSVRRGRLERTDRAEAAEELAEQGHWEQGLKALLDDGDVAGAVAFLEERVLGLLARGDLMLVRAAVARVPRRERSLLLRIADADAAARVHAADLGEIQALAREAAAAASGGGTDHRWWLAAVEAEHFLWRGDMVAVTVAARALAEIPDDPLLPADALAARGRLRRIAALAHLFSFAPDGAARAEEALEFALVDLGRAGWEEERAMTSVLFHVVAASVSFDGFEVSLPVVRESIDRLRVLGSAYTAVALAGLAFVCLLAGDVPEVHAALAEAADLGAAMTPTADALMRHVASMVHLLGAGPTPAVLAELDDVADVFRAVAVEAAGSVALTVAWVLLDMGDAEGARTWAGRARSAQLITPYARLDRDTLEARLGTSRGDAGAVAVLGECVDRGVAAGLTRYSGIKALQGAHDCARAGLAAEAAALRERGLDLVPAPGRRTIWEELWARPLPAVPSPVPAPPDDPARAVLPGAGASIRVLGPDVRVERGSGPVVLTGTSARIVAFLVAERRPVAVERLLDALWPDEVSAATARNRLRVALHRLRGTLGLGAGELVVRAGDLVRLEPPAGWRVDAWDFWDLSGGDAAARQAALDLYRGDFAGEALAYEDSVAGERARLRARFVDVAAGLLAAGAADPGVLAGKVLALGIADPDLAAALAAALRGAGRHAEATAVEEAAGAAL